MGVNLDWHCLVDAVAEEDEEYGEDDHFARLYRAACKIQHFWLKRQLLRTSLKQTERSPKHAAKEASPRAADDSDSALTDSDASDTEAESALAERFRRIEAMNERERRADEQAERRAQAALRHVMEMMQQIDPVKGGEQN